MDVRTCTPRPPPRTSPRPPRRRRTGSRCCAPGMASSSSAPQSDGQPVALVLQRSTYGHEVDSVLGFSQLNDPGFVRDAKSFQQAASDIDYTFNWFYADSTDISYYSSGLLPKRRRRSSRTCRTGPARSTTGRAGCPSRSTRGRPTRKRGYLVSWNNKPAPGFVAADDNWSYGAVLPLAGAREAAAAQDPGKKKIDLPGMVGVMAGGATADSRAAYTLPWLLKVIGKDPQDRAGPAPCSAVARGRARRASTGTATAPTSTRPRSRCSTPGGRTAHESVAYDAMSGRLGAADPPAAAAPRRPPAARPGLFVQRGRLVRLPLQGPPLGAREATWPAPYSTGYCGKGSLQACRATLRASLAPPSPGCCRSRAGPRSASSPTTRHEDDIRSNTAGVVGVRPIDWQNRPTFQQVVEFLSHR